MVQMLTGLFGGGYEYEFYFDWTYIIVIIALVLTLIASARVRMTVNKFAQVYSYRGMTGAQVAESILRENGLYDVPVQHVSGNLTDHYDPSERTLSLSDSVYGSSSISAIAVAAHECGHAIQHAKSYGPLNLRTKMVPIVSFASSISWILIFVGLVFGTGGAIVLNIGIFMFAAVVLFQFITLPVEFNASNRALAILQGSNYLAPEEHAKARKVLRAAAMTYVAGAASAVLQLLRILFISWRRRRGG